MDETLTLHYKQVAKLAAKAEQAHMLAARLSIAWGKVSERIPATLTQEEVTELASVTTQLDKLAMELSDYKPRPLFGVGTVF